MKGNIWRQAVLGDLLATPLRTGISKQNEPSAKHLCLGLSSVRSGVLDLSAAKPIGLTPAEAERNRVKAGAFYVVRGNGSIHLVGRGAVAPKEISEGLVFPDLLIEVNPNPEVLDIHYLRWAWEAPSVRREIESRSMTTSGIFKINLGNLAKVPLPLPLIETQRSIASLLNKQMSAVEQSRQGIEAIRQGLDDFVAAWIREGIQHADTELRPVGDVLEEVTQGIGSGWADYPVLGATRGGVAPARDKVGKAPGRYKPVRPGSIFYNPMRIMIGSIAMLDEDDSPGITSPDYVVVRPRTEAVHHLWVYEWLRGSQGAAFIQTLARGGVRERMLFNRLKAGDIPVPSRSWQQRFAEISRHRRQAVRLLDDQREALDKLPGAYLREAFGNLS